MASRIEDYALIGDCETAALVAKDGSIDWLCWPRFDSDACFAALLGTPENGRWRIAPVDAVAKVERRYRGDTLILETRMETAEGSVLVVDFMPLRGEGKSDLVRIVSGERGTVPMRSELAIRFGYGKSVPWVNGLAAGIFACVAGPDMIVLHSPVGLEHDGSKTSGDFTISEGEVLTFVLGYSPSHLPPRPKVDSAAALKDTEDFWTGWSGIGETGGEWSEAVRRSLITLKALTYAPTGGIVAAPTTSLPEQLGGPRNWDYRFCWLRDATLTLLALMNAGHVKEAKAWRNWLLRAAAGAPWQLQIMYGIGGERRMLEWEAGWLSGYEGSRPVRIGNAAHDQLQLDVYGEVLDALHQGRRAGLAPNADAWTLQVALLEDLERKWQQPDEGIWEVRGGRRHFTFSKAMAWAAFDRGIKGVEELGLDGPVDRWRAVRGEVHADVCSRGFDPELGSFVQFYGSKQLDASLLLIPTLGFLPVSDPRILGTVAAIEKHLAADGLLLRYDTAQSEDGLPAGEGAFLACSFWLVDVYVMMGRVVDARRLFERLLSLRNDVGLLAEEYDAVAGRQVGNFPQAFSHIALLNSAQNLGRAQRPVEQRSDRSAQG